MQIPYYPRAPLTEVDWFYGRSKELDHLFAYLNKTTPQNVQIVGQRRIGKTWFLRYIEKNSALRDKYLDDSDKFIFIYWDLQSEPALAPELFMDKLVEFVLSHLPPDLRVLCQETIQDVEKEDHLLEIMDILEMEDYHIIFLLDEFAAITRNESFAESFFSHLRSIFGRPSITCVTASYLSLGDMSHLGPDSPFFNIFSRLQLRLFTDEEAEGFVREPLEAIGVKVDAATVKDILKLTGSHPCFISQFCHDITHLVGKNGQITRDDVTKYQTDFQTNVFNDFSYYVDPKRLTEDELAMLRDIGEGNQPSQVSHPLVVKLIDLSLIQERNGKIVPFSQPFKQFVRETKGTDVFFSQAFNDATLDAPSFVRLCEIVLVASTHIPEPTRRDLETAIRTIHGRPQDAMRICGRDVLDPIFDFVYQKEIQRRWDGDQYGACQLFDDRSQNGLFPKHLAAHLQSVRVSGAHGSHPFKFKEACTPARAFLTVLETIHLAEEVYKRYP